VNQGVSVTKSVTSPLGLFVLYSPKGTYDPLFLANYAYVNINDPMTRVPGIGQVQIFGASQYAIPSLGQSRPLAKLDITVNEIGRRPAGPEHRQPVGTAWRRPGAPRPGIHVHGAGARSPGEPRGIRKRRGAGEAGRRAGPGSRTSPAWSSARRTTSDGPPERPAGRPHRRLPASRLQRIDTMKGATKLMDEIKARFPADSTM